MFKSVLAALAVTLSIGVANAEPVDRTFSYGGVNYNAPHSIEGELRIINMSGLILNIEGTGLKVDQNCNFNVFTQDYHKENQCDANSFGWTNVGLTLGKQISFYNPGERVKASPVWAGYGSTYFQVPTIPNRVRIIELWGAGVGAYYKEYVFDGNNYMQDNPPGIDLFVRAI